MCINLTLPFTQFIFFFFNDTATTEIYTLSLHDALPIFGIWQAAMDAAEEEEKKAEEVFVAAMNQADWKDKILADRKSTRLNSSHLVISYAVFCLKKKKRRKLLYKYIPSVTMSITHSISL